MTNKIIDIAGQKFGTLTAISYTGRTRKNGDSIWLCNCECGNTKEAGSSDLRRGRTKSCGIPHGILGQRFGRLEPVQFLENKSERSQPRSRWLCQCDCGKTVKIYTAHLKDGSTRSCGCLRADMHRTIPLSKYPVIFAAYQSGANVSVLVKEYNASFELIRRIIKHQRASNGGSKDAPVYESSKQYSPVEVGLTINGVKIISPSERKYYWNCECSSCGTQFTKTTYQIRHGKAKCKCSRGKNSGK